MMADWYVSLPAYNAVPQWQANTAYTVGQFVRSLVAPSAFYNWCVHRCTTAGTSGATEPGWSFVNTGTTTSGTATFTNVSGQEAYGWSAALGTVYSVGNSGNARAQPGDRVFVSSDHTESSAGGSYAFGSSVSLGTLQLFSVNRAGSVPPVAANLQPGAAISFTSGNLYLEALSNMYWQGFTFNCNGTFLYFNNSYVKQHYFKDCAFVLGAAMGKISSNNYSGKVTFDNTTVQFSVVGQGFASTSYTLDLTWLNTLNAIVGTTYPTNLFTSTGGGGRCQAVCRGVDFGAFNGGFIGASPSSTYVLLDSCKVSPAAVRLSGVGTGTSGHEEIELVNCDVSGVLTHERFNSYGSMLTDRNTVMTGGATDMGGLYSFKLTNNVATAGSPLSVIESLFMDVENTVLGTPRFATVEIISSVALTTADIRLVLTYPGTTGTPLTKSGSTLVTELSPATALPTSTAPWVNPPATPVKQYLQVPFTALTVGRVRGRVRLNKIGTIVWINPQLKLS
jgi:hypothetical protein